MWASDCDSVRQRLPLLAGNDLPRTEETELVRHLADCAGCQARWESLKQSQQWLEQARVASAGAGGPGLREESVWTGVRQGLSRVDEQRSEDGRSWRSWLPAVATMAACLTVAIIGGDLWQSFGGGRTVVREGGQERFTGQALLGPNAGTRNLPVGNMPAFEPGRNEPWSGSNGNAGQFRRRNSGPYRNY